MPARTLLGVCSGKKN